MPSAFEMWTLSLPAVPWTVLVGPAEVIGNMVGSFAMD
jgi:hypothetical protein